MPARRISDKAPSSTFFTFPGDMNTAQIPRLAKGFERGINWRWHRMGKQALLWAKVKVACLGIPSFRWPFLAPHVRCSHNIPIQVTYQDSRVGGWSSLGR